MARVPPELVFTILELAYPEPWLFPPPLLSKSFLPIYRSIIHRVLRLSDLPYLIKFNHRCRRDAELGGLVRLLEDVEPLEPVTDDSEENNGLPRRRLRAYTWVSQETMAANEDVIQTFWRHLDNLQVIRLNEFWSHFLLFSDLSASFIGLQLQSLSYLDITSPYLPPSGSSQHKLFDLLAHCRSLSHLRLSTNSILPRTTQTYPQIKRLTLQGVVFDEEGDFFYQSFPHLSTLEIAYCKQQIEANSRLLRDPDLDRLPPLISALSLRQEVAYRTLQFPKQDYPHLETLQLDLGPIDQSFALSLSHLTSIRSVAIGGSHSLSGSKLITSVENLLENLPSIDHLELNTMTGKTGTRVPIGGPLAQVHDDILLVATDWILPNFELAAPALLAALNKFRKSGVALSGTTVDALEVWNDWNRERERCIEAYLESEEARKQNLTESLISIE